MKWFSRKLLALVAGLVGIGATTGQTDPSAAGEHATWLVIAYIVAQAVVDTLEKLGVKKE